MMKRFPSDTFLCQAAYMSSEGIGDRPRFEFGRKGYYYVRYFFSNGRVLYKVMDRSLGS